MSVKTGVSLDEIRHCREILEAVSEDRALLAALPEEERVALMMAAGRFSRPARLELTKKNKAIRKVRRQLVQAQDRATRAQADIRVARETAVFCAPAEVPRERRVDGPEFSKPRSCYVCKTEFRRLHFFYDSMCKACGDFNYAKRFQTAGLSGKTALVTGARVKIGYQAALKLLRAGAKVIVVTRFPHDAALRYAREPDYAAFSSRLQIHGLDLRHSPSVELFARFLVSTEPRLDALVNNACQTVRRPAGFFAHMLELERTPVAELPAAAQGPLQAHDALRRQLAAPAPAQDGNPLAIVGQQGRRGAGLTSSAELSQLRYSYDDAEEGRDLFPLGKLDADLQQVDLRRVNSWRLALAEVSTPEMLEVQLINAVAPFILNARLKPLMLKTPNRDKHVVNVSAMEGIFSRGTKTDKHPHTNMAKAGLNMMTLTSAPDYARDGIFMNAVDTGWVTDEDPAQHSQRKKEELDFQPPLDIVDGAARVLDPLFDGLNTGRHLFGKFLKDYKPSPW